MKVDFEAAENEEDNVLLEEMLKESDSPSKPVELLHQEMGWK
jgi:hypothetical protein